jgi:diguanylate cyclase (GGDEF)-like protein
MRRITARPGSGAGPVETATGARIALLMDDSPIMADAVQQAHQYLAANGYQVAVVADGDWPQITRDVLPAVVVLYSDAAPEALAAKCRRIKEYGAPVAVMVVLGAANEKDVASLRTDLRAAGVDGVLGIHNSVAELEDFVALLVRLVGLQLELANTREELDQVSQFDSTTKLFNRRSFFQAAHRECSRAWRYRHPLACLMIGINYLEHFNRTFGYACGDYLLGAIGDAMRQTTRDTDIAARFSDKKMVILLPETDIAGAAQAREKLEQSIRDRTFVWGEQQLPVSISVGEAERRWDETGSEEPSTLAIDEEDNIVSVRVELAELLEEADAALAVARKGAHCPEIFVEDDLGAINPEEADSHV